MQCSPVSIHTPGPGGKALKLAHRGAASTYQWIRCVTILAIVAPVKRIRSVNTNDTPVVVVIADDRRR
jgi:hypothetical protein